MAQSPLFDPPPDRLGARLHDEVFGALPTTTARSLDLPEVAAAVRPLLTAGWRPAQLAARVGALPAATDPVATVIAFLVALQARDSPQHSWERERAAREQEQAEHRERGHEAASDESRTRWAAEARQALGLPPRPRAAPTTRTPAVCSSCGAAGQFFVTRQVRLCAGCVELLGTGTACVHPRAHAS